VFLPMAALMVVMLGVMFRSVRETLLVVAALVLSGLLLLAIMSWTGMRWNFLNIAATPLLLGTGIDYGIHVMMTLRRNGGDVAAMWHGTGKAVVVEGNPFHSEITGVTLGAIPSVILLDGQRIYEGAILQDGSVLTDIAENQLIITGPQGKRKIPLNLGPKPALE
jgi:hypothetical protein